MKVRMSDEDEIKIYHILCDISKICKNYFYERKYLPDHYCSADDAVQNILASSKELKSEYKEINQRRKDSNYNKREE